MASFIEMRNICKSFSGVAVLKSVNFSVERGEVHALIGENGAGKSTLMKILLGIYSADSGEIRMDGREVKFRNPGEALKNGLSMIHQEISLIHSVDVAENVWMGREKDFSRFGLIDTKRRAEATKKLLADCGITLDPDAQLRTLSVAQLQLIELARALSYAPSLIIMDEPTSALTESEVELLFQIVRRLKDSGTSIIFISHKLEEMFRICDRITVLRDGEFVGTRQVAETDMDEVISMIIGRTLTNVFPHDPVEIGEEMLRVEGLTRFGKFEDVHFSVRAGEVLGFCGLMGAGRTEVMSALFGAEPLDSGIIYIRGQEVKINRPGDAIALGLGMVTEDRLRTGAFHNLGVLENTSAVCLPVRSFLHWIQGKQEQDNCDKIIRDLRVVLASTSQPIRSLSGGNQQKVILGRWLLSSPRIIILDEPTRGIDVGSKSEIYALIHGLAKQGLAVILVSSEMPELLGLSDRIIVMREGRTVYEADKEKTDSETLITHAYGVKAGRQQSSVQECGPQPCCEHSK